LFDSTFYKSCTYYESWPWTSHDIKTSELAFSIVSLAQKEKLKYLKAIAIINAGVYHFTLAGKPSCLTRYVYGAVPPEGSISIEPLYSPQDGEVLAIATLIVDCARQRLTAKV